MGFNTVIHILNDMFHEIKRNPKAFVEQIDQKMNEARSRDPHEDFMRELQGPFGSDVKVMPSHHADDKRIYVSGGNTIFEIDTLEAERLIRKGFLELYEKELKSVMRQCKYVQDWIERYLEEEEPLLYKARKAMKSKRRKKSEVSKS